MKDLAWVFGVLVVVGALGFGGLVLGGGLGDVGDLSFASDPLDDWDPVLAPYVDFIEAERGLEFQRTVDVRYADISAEVAADFAAFREEEANNIPDSLAFSDPYGEAYELLGLVDFDEGESQAANDEAIAENAGAFYDSWVKEIVLPEGESEVALRITIVHELVHALQDQHGLIGGLYDTADSSQARLALVEGDAERIALAWFATQSPAQQEEYFDAIGYDPNAPIEELEPNTYFESTFFVSYSIGPPLVETIIETKGIEELDRLLRASDIGTTERFVDPLRASETSTVDALGQIELPEGSFGADGDLGALTWFAALAPAAGTEAAFDALIGYDDDAFVVYSDSTGDTCVRFLVLFDTAADATEFVDVAVGLLGMQDSEASGTEVVLQICSPIGDPNNQNPAVMFPLIVANEMTLYHLQNGELEETARCAAIAQASTISVLEPLSSFAGWDVLVGNAEQFVAECASG